MNEEQTRAEFEAFQRNELMTKKNNTEADADFALEFNGKEYVNSPCMQMAWEAWQAALSAKSVPEGWKLVPTEPTDEMLLKGGDIDASPDGLLRAIYSEMIEAAPQPTDERVREMMLKACELRDKYSAMGYTDASYQVSDEYIVDGLLAKTYVASMSSGEQEKQ